MIWFLAFRNVILLRKRYMLMGLAIAVGFMLITVLTGLSNGALVAIKNKAARYFSGQICVIGLTGWQSGIEHPQPLVDSIRASKLPIKNVSARTVYYGSTSAFFGGKSLLLKRLIGVDFEREKGELSKLPFMYGGIDGVIATKNGIIIGKAIANALKIRHGDDLTLSIITADGQYNTGTFIVQGIFDEVNVFGYAVYIDIEELNQFLQAKPGSATEIAVYTSDGENLVAFSEKLRQFLEKEYPVYPPILTRFDYARMRGTLTEFPETLAVVSIEAQLDEINTFLNAFNIATYFVLIVFLLIIMSGITNTFRVLVYDRTREIGTLRVLGMHKSHVCGLFLIEAATLAVIASAVGFFAALVIFYMANLFNFQAVSVVTMFTENGRLQYYVSAKHVLLNLFFILLTVLAAVARPAKYASSIPPAQALRQP